MKCTMQMFAPVCWLLCWMLPVCSKKISSIVNLPEANLGIRMSMVNDAVDDMYFGCNETMARKIKDKYFGKENTGAFKKVWENAKLCVKKRLEHKIKGDEALTQDHIQAICVYTSSFEDIYKTFNDENPKGTNEEVRGNVNQIMRFGFFASSSLKKTLDRFGNKTCFEIKTCLGAFLKPSSSLGKLEEEVLIPPYEKFKIIKEMKGRDVEGLGDCEVVYILESAGIESNLNCKDVKSYGSPTGGAK